MKQRHYYSRDDLYFSAVYGDAVYEQIDIINDPLYQYSKHSKGQSPLLNNLVTGETVFLRKIDVSEKEIQAFYSQRILDPPISDTIFWPVDLVSLTETQQSICTLYVDREYKEEQTPNEERSGAFAVAFPVVTFFNLISAEDILTQIKPLNWRNRQVQKLAVQIVSAIDSLNKAGWIYNDFHLSRFFRQEDGHIYLDYSNLACKWNNFSSTWDRPLCIPKNDNYPVEFADPAFMQKIISYVDMQSQNYSLCALLFYLFFGRYAYDGRLLAGHIDNNDYTHYIKFRDYYEHPVFIFDPLDSDNALGDFDEDIEVANLWGACPPLLKSLFLETLVKENAERHFNSNHPNAAEWLRRFRKLAMI